MEYDNMKSTTTGALAGNPSRYSGDQVLKQARESGVGSELDELRQAVHVHSEVLTSLVNRIGGVLLDVPSSPAASSDTRTPDRNLSSLGDSIRAIRREIEALSGLVREVTRRVDL